MFIWAYLPDLVYLDSRRIDDHMASLPLGVPALGDSLQVPGFWERDMEAKSRAAPSSSLLSPAAVGDPGRTLVANVGLAHVARLLPRAACSPHSYSGDSSLLVSIWLPLCDGACVLDTSAEPPVLVGFLMQKVSGGLSGTVSLTSDEALQECPSCWLRALLL